MLHPRTDACCGILGIRIPVLQAGMGTASGPELAAAVSEAGGLGIVGALRRKPDEVRDLVRRTRRLTTRPFGVNHVIEHLDAAALEATIEEEVPVISTAWGNPAGVVRRAEATGAKVVHQVTTVEEARQARDAGVALIVAQGNQGGGHVGHLSSFTLVPEVVDAVSPLPVLAAGGIVDARGVAAALSLGAAGVLMGTRFIATPEAPVAERWKLAIVAATGGDTVTSTFYDAMRGERWPGATVRTVRNRWTDEWSGRETEWAAVAPGLRSEFLRSFGEGEFPMAGEGCGLIHDIVPAGELVERIWRETLALIASAGAGTAVAGPQSPA